MKLSFVHSSFMRQHFPSFSRSKTCCCQTTDPTTTQTFCGGNDCTAPYVRIFLLHPVSASLHQSNHHRWAPKAEETEARTDRWKTVSQGRRPKNSDQETKETELREQEVRSSAAEHGTRGDRLHPRHRPQPPGAPHCAGEGRQDAGLTWR